jgi:hypothetical protein
VPQIGLDQTDYITQARKRYSAAAKAWKHIREEAKIDLKFVSGDQWDPSIKDAREDSNRPALSFNRLHTVVQAITNQARQQRPQPKINPSDEQGSAETADVLEGHIRHIQYASQADVAYDGAVEYSASCGFGFYRITTEYVDERSFNQEPRIRRILDPMTVYFDPDAEEADFSDAKWCFVRKRLTREDYKAQFGKEAVDFGSDEADMQDWSEEDHVWIAEYWQVKITKSKLQHLSDGSTRIGDDSPLPEGVTVTQEREIDDREVTFDLIDGARSLSKTDWLGKWIPIIPVLGKELVVDGKREFISLIRFARDPQRLLNAYKSGIAEQIGLATRSPWIGAKGQFKDPRWKNANTENYSFLEYDSVTVNGQPAPPPQRNQFEAPIQALSSAALQEADALKAATGYIDSVLQPSRADLSGVAVQRRQQGADLTNFHFQDNLVRSQWHAANVLLDLISKLIDVPREIRTLAIDGTPSLAPVGIQQPDGSVQMVQGKEDQKHHILDAGSYDVTISTGPSYNTKLEEERDVLLQVLQQNPQAWLLYSDVLFKLMGYPELEERAKLTLPPPIQQAIAAKQGPGAQIPPAVQQQLTGLMAQNQQLKAGMQQAIQIIKTKQIEVAGKLQVEKVKAVRELTVEGMKNQHDATKAMLDASMEAVNRMTEMLHETEMAPDPNLAGAQPSGAVQ